MGKEKGQVKDLEAPAVAEGLVQVIGVDLLVANSPEQDSFVRATGKRQIIKAGRRMGKTVGASIKAVLGFLGYCAKCMGEGCEECDYSGRVAPKRVLYAAPTAEQVGKFWFEVCRALGKGIEAGVWKKDETNKTIEVVGTEQRIKAKTAWNANTLKGDYADLLELEEFQLMNEDVWGEVGQPMLLDNNGTAVFIFTPPSLKSEGISKAKDPRHASKLYQKALKDPKWQVFHFTSFANPDLSQEALAEIQKDMSLDAYRREILAEDDEIESSWLVYGKFKDEICRIKRFSIPKEWKVVTSHDFGEANPCALFAARVQLPLPEGAPPYLRFGDTVIFREYAPGAGSSTVQHIQKFKELTEGYKIEISVGGNITTEGEIRTGYGAQGWPISAPPITGVKAQIDRTIGLMELNKLYIFEDLYGLLGQIASCLWVLDEGNKPLNKVKNESRWHYLACLRSLCVFLPYERHFLTNDTNKIKIRVY